MNSEQVKFNVLLTGATGFVGSKLLDILIDKDYNVCPVARRNTVALDKYSPFQINELNSANDWTDALDEIDVVVHCAARVHVMNETAADPEKEFLVVNTDATLNLAKQSAESGVRRFVFISSIKVAGERSELDKPLRESDEPTPLDPYGYSKHLAEIGLRKIAEETGMEVVILRPSLIYGPGVKANFETMMKWLVKGIPLPLGGIKNKRSLLSLTNFIDFIVLCIEHPNAANETFFVSDGCDLSTSELLQKLGLALGKKPLLLPIPGRLLNTILCAIGLSSFSNRLLGSLQVSMDKASNILDWKPKITIEEGLKETSDYYKQGNKV